MTSRKPSIKKPEDEYDFVFEESIDFVSHEVFRQKLRLALQSMIYRL